MEALKATGICLDYGSGDTRTRVLKDFNLTLAPGAFEAIMGPSGSGKSTFLHLAAGLLAPTAGTIEVGGVNVTAMSDGAATKFRRRHEGVVFQSFNLLDSLTVAENIVLPVKLDHGRPDAKRLETLVQKLGLTGKTHRHPAELSGGERQRVAIARALFAEPDVILADEPTGNLDVNASHAICDLLKSLNKDEKSAILLITHDPVVASAANRVHFLNQGQLAVSFDTNHDAELISRKYLSTYSQAN